MTTSTIEKTSIIDYSAQQMFDLVDNIEAYPEFLPWCRGSDVLSRTDKEVCATLHLAFGGVERAFTTRNRREPPTKISLHLIDGPFQTLEGTWRFEPLSDTQCRIILNLAFEFDLGNRLLSLTITPLFRKIVLELVNAFHKRAKVVYG